MARNFVRDERQGDLFGAPPPSIKPPRRVPAPKPRRDEAPASARVALTTPGEALTKPTIDEILENMPDRDLADFVVEATRVVKRRLARGQGRGPAIQRTGPKKIAAGRCPAPDRTRTDGVRGFRRYGMNHAKLGLQSAARAVFPDASLGLDPCRIAKLPILSPRWLQRRTCRVSEGQPR